MIFEDAIFVFLKQQFKSNKLLLLTLLIIYKQCYCESMNKTEILDSSDTHENKTGCCIRMVKFQCWKQLLIKYCYFKRSSSTE